MYTKKHSISFEMLPLWLMLEDVLCIVQLPILIREKQIFMFLQQTRKENRNSQIGVDRKSIWILQNLVQQHWQVNRYITYIIKNVLSHLLINANK